MYLICYPVTEREGERKEILSFKPGKHLKIVHAAAYALFLNFSSTYKIISLYAGSTIVSFVRWLLLIRGEQRGRWQNLKTNY